MVTESMGLSLSVLVTRSMKFLIDFLFGGLMENAVQKLTVRSISFDDDSNKARTVVRKVSFKKDDLSKRVGEKFDCSIDNDMLSIEESTGATKKHGIEKLKLETTTTTVMLRTPLEAENARSSLSELDKAAVKLQKVYKSYRTRRNLADCTVVIEELWWKAIDFAALKRDSVSFFEKPETAVSRWVRAGSRIAKVGKGLSKDETAQKLALRHWLEAIDPRHRYGHNLHLYYIVWFDTESCQPFFYWLDVGDGREVNLDKCPRTKLQRECIQYLGPKEREAYEVIIENGKLVYKRDRSCVQTIEGTKWIFVLSTSRKLYIGAKKKGLFQHSSFLAGAATTAAGRLVIRNGVLEAIWAYSGHYRPTEENFKDMLSFLDEQGVDLTNVKTCAMDDDVPPPETKEPLKSQADSEKPLIEKGKYLSGKWSTGAGPRIGCVRDYPTSLQFKALEHVNLSPKVRPSRSFAFPAWNSDPIPSPRPSPKVHLSPQLAYVPLPDPSTVVACQN